MTQHDTQRIVAALKVLADHYPRQEVPGSTIVAYTRSLSDLPVNLVVMAIDRCAKTRTFFPSVAEIRQEVGEGATDPNQIAEAAWIEVEGQIRRCGATKTRTLAGGVWHDSPDPVFSSEIIRRVVESIGWKNLCLEPRAKMRTDFIFAYRNWHQARVTQIQRGDIDHGAQLPAGSGVKEIA